MTNLDHETCTGRAALPASAGQSDKQVATWQFHMSDSWAAKKNSTSAHQAVFVKHMLP